MKPSSKMILAGALLSGSQAVASPHTLPNSCKEIANLSVQILNQSAEEGDDSHSNLTLKNDFVHFPITKATFLGNCDENENRLKKSWCRAAGGSPDVYQLNVSERADGGNAYPKATVIVTYNRGSCRVDEIISK